MILNLANKFKFIIILDFSMLDGLHTLAQLIISEYPY